MTNQPRVRTFFHTNALFLSLFPHLRAEDKRSRRTQHLRQIPLYYYGGGNKALQKQRFTLKFSQLLKKKKCHLKCFSGENVKKDEPLPTHRGLGSVSS